MTERILRNKHIALALLVTLGVAVTAAAVPAKIVVLWTDALVYLLLAMIIGAGVYIRRRQYLRHAWRQVLRRRLASSALVILLAYLFIGLLDCVHFRLQLPPQEGSEEVHYAPETLSVLDLVLTPLRTRVEKTYSAPFATHLYTKETLELPDGSTQRDYPRLHYGGAHLQDPARDKWPDIAAKVGSGLLAGVLLWALVCAGIIYYLARSHGCAWRTMYQRIITGQGELPWRTLLGTLGLVLVLGGGAAQLSLYYHIFGTDKVGMDVFYLTLKSIRTGLLIGTLTTLIMLPFAVALGIAAGYLRGWVDDVIQYVYTTLNSIPSVLLIAAAVLIMQAYIDMHPELFETAAERADLRLLFLCLILGVTSWTGLCRLLRGEAMKLSELDYVQAAQALGVRRARILGRHILPNVMHIVLISLVLDFSGLVLAEAVLSYVGVGVDPTMHSWGNMINGARLEMAREPMVWWSLLAAFVFMFVLVLAANLFSDAVRDAFDPRMRQ